MKLNITPDGIDVILQCMEGSSSIVFTSIAYGNGDDAGAKAKELTNQVLSIPITAIQRNEGSQFVSLTGVLNNANIEKGFSATETGVYVKEPGDETGEKELLFAYGYSEQGKAAVIPASSDYAFETTDVVFVYVGQTEDVSAIINDSLMFVTKAEFKEHLEKVNPHRITPDLIGAATKVSPFVHNELTVTKPLYGKDGGNVYAVLEVDEWGNVTLKSDGDTITTGFAPVMLEIASAVSGGAPNSHLISVNRGNGKFLLFGQHNKTKGTYVGNGAKHEIFLHGIGEMVLITSSEGIALVTTQGGFAMGTETNSASSLKPTDAHLENTESITMKLALKTSNSKVNKNGIRYNYTVL